jgi:hypothetical protein
MREREGTLPTAKELEIAELFRYHQSSKDVAIHVLKMLQDPEINYEDQRTLIGFLFNSGYYRLVSQRLAESLKLKNKVSWSLMAEIFSLETFSYKKSYGDFFCHGYSEEGRDEPFTYSSKKLDTKDPRFNELRLQTQNKIQKKYADLKTQMLEKFEFFKEQRLVEEERATALEIHRFFPNLPEIKQFIVDAEGRWARNLIESRPLHRLDTIDREYLVSSTTAEEQGIKSAVIETAQKVAHANPDLAYDLSLLLYFLDFRQEALTLIQQAPKSFASDWYKLELLLETRYFVDTLELVQELELEYANNPDTMFATTYARARALKGLGRPALAIDLLQSIVNIKPNYRSAQSFLSDWIED